MKYLAYSAIGLLGILFWKYILAGLVLVLVWLSAASTVATAPVY